MNVNLYLSLLLMAATGCSCILVYLSWKRRELPIATSYGLGMLTGAFYTFGYAFEIVSSTLDQIQFWLSIEYIGIPFGTVFWMAMVLQYTGRQAYLRKCIFFLLMIIPVTTFVAHATNEWHHLFYRSMTLDYSQGFPLVKLVKGPLYQVHVIYNYTMFLLGMLLLWKMYRQAEPHMKKQVALMMIGSCGPYGFTLVYLLGILPIPIDISPFGFVISGIFFLFGIYHFNMLRLAPLAFQKVFESMQDAVIILDLDHNITGFNESASLGIQNLERKKSMGQSITQVLSTYPKLLEKVLQEPFSDNKLWMSNGVEGSYYNVQMSYIHRSQLHHHPIGKMLLLKDITQSVQLEEGLREKAKQLRELNVFKDQMFNVVAHDIRDPLAVLLNLMELMEEEMQRCGRNHEEIVQEMSQQVHKTFVLVESLLDWFRSQRGGMVFRPVVRDLALAFEMNRQLLQSRSDSKGIQLACDIPTHMYVFADKEMLDLIIRNLLSNAIKFTGIGGSILVNAVKSEDHIIIAVSDSGAGISADQMDSLLHEEYAVSSEGTAGERGVGLGLTLCREFIRLNGGKIWFDSIPLKGSTFYFTMPIASEAVVSEWSRNRGRAMG
ncbi:signal transduction histidine kinase [Paenibacillus shirakamiensis]|uniref:histidine kinase n=1 Tax=Paenibacillus shirakamiensis TaxID=1265935 RepID=A0ABS4JKL5_9BACL|nr:histidine kinase N-terminal 7TM domain-containing protein [Paenibacillus shirakamiensis]MBP2002243.1 signal transduction histidine kinase [Paenibacillus shirakamiensis]